jgi:TetR/AcrR family transcriptional regulator, transcriptional repressor for nem operon
MANKRTELQTLAQAIVQRSGLRELSFRQLAEQTGVKSSSVHYYFPEKHDLTAVLI